jgi:hypothetical protein
MIATQLMSQDPLPCVPARSTATVEREGQWHETLPADSAATVATQFQPLDPNIVSEDIPAFFIGRNKEGFWVARDAKGRIGGIFLLENSALSFARKKSRPAVCATIFPSERFELDLENSGSPLVAHLAGWTRFATCVGQLVAVFIGKLTGALERRSNDF